MVDIDNLLQRIPARLADWYRNQAERHVQKKEALNYIKFVIPGKIAIEGKGDIPFVISEIHVEEGTQIRDSHYFNIKETPIQHILDYLATCLDVTNNQDLLELNFAGSRLPNNLSLNSQGVAYPDKVFLPIDNKIAFTKDSILHDFENVKANMEEIARIIQRSPELYIEVIKQFKELVESDGIGPDHSDFWNYQLIIRNFAIFSTGEELRQRQLIINDSVAHMLNWLEVLHLKESLLAVQYSLINALEWQAYMYPVIFFEACGTRHNQRMTKLGDTFSNTLCRVIENAASPGRIRMEACWALSWAGISNYQFGKKITPLFFKIIQKSDTLGQKEIGTAIFVALMRSTCIRHMFLGADENENFGWFQNTLGEDNNLIQITNRDFSDLRELNIDEWQNIIEDPNIFHGLGMMYSILEDYSAAGRFFELSSYVDGFMGDFRMGLALMAYSEHTSSGKDQHLSDKIDLMKRSRERFQAALDDSEKEGKTLFKSHILMKKQLAEARLFFLKGVDSFITGKRDQAESLFQDAHDSYKDIDRLNLGEWEDRSEVSPMDHSDLFLVDRLQELAQICLICCEDHKATSNKAISAIDALLVKSGERIEGYSNFYASLRRALLEYKDTKDKQGLFLNLCETAFPFGTGSCPLTHCPGFKLEIVSPDMEEESYYLVRGGKYLIFKYSESPDDFQSIELKFRIRMRPLPDEDREIIIKDCRQRRLPLYISIRGETTRIEIPTGKDFKVGDVLDSPYEIRIGLGAMLSKIKKAIERENKKQKRDVSEWHISDYLDGESLLLNIYVSYPGCGPRDAGNLRLYLVPSAEYERYPRKCNFKQNFEDGENGIDCYQPIENKLNRTIFFAYKFGGEYTNESEMTTLVQSIKNIMQSVGLKIYDPEKMSHEDRVCQICFNILSRKFFVFEASFYSLNVWFEVGFACAKNKKYWGFINENKARIYDRVAPLTDFISREYKNGADLIKIIDNVAKEIQSWKFENHHSNAFIQKYVQDDVSKTPLGISATIFIADASKLNKNWDKDWVLVKQPTPKIDIAPDKFNIGRFHASIRYIQQSKIIFGVLNSKADMEYNCTVSLLLGIAAGLGKNYLFVCDDMTVFNTFDFLHSTVQLNAKSGILGISIVRKLMGLAE